MEKEEEVGGAKMDGESGASKRHFNRISPKRTLSGSGAYASGAIEDLQTMSLHVSNSGDLTLPIPSRTKEKEKSTSNSSNTRGFEANQSLGEVNSNAYGIKSDLTGLMEE